MFGYVGQKPVQHIDPFGLVDLNLTPIKDPNRGGFDHYNPPNYFTVTTHGSLEQPGLIQQEDGRFVSSDIVSQRILDAGWDRKKPILLLICYAGYGEDSSFAASLSGKLSDLTGRPVTVYGTEGVVAGFPVFPPPFTQNVVIPTVPYWTFTGGKIKNDPADWAWWFL